MHVSWVVSASQVAFAAAPGGLPAAGGPAGDPGGVGLLPTAAGNPALLLFLAASLLLPPAGAQPLRGRGGLHCNWVAFTGCRMTSAPTLDVDGAPGSWLGHHMIMRCALSAESVAAGPLGHAPAAITCCGSSARTCHISRSCHICCCCNTGAWRDVEGGWLSCEAPMCCCTHDAASMMTLPEMSASSNPPASYVHCMSSSWEFR